MDKVKVVDLKRDFYLINEIENIILQCVDMEQEITRSDLQGVCFAKAIEIIKLVKSVNKNQ